MSKHTPGPWSIRRIASTAVESSTGRLVASTGGYTTNMDDGEHVLENEANSRLIAAAPEMYEALNDLLRADTPDAYDLAHAKVRAAIRKAEGESE